MKKVIAYLHTHWDREWYREFEAFRLRLLDVLDEVFDALEKNEIPYFYLDGQTAMLEDYLTLRPEKKELAARLITENKIDSGPFYCSSDSFLVMGEMYLRNLIFGMQKANEFKENRFIAYIADSFGHSQAICEIFRTLNLDKAILWRGLGDKKADLLWNGIKTTYLIQGYFQDFFTSTLTIEEKAKSVEKYLDKISQKSGDIILLPIGGDHLGIPQNLNRQINEINKILDKKYEIILSSPFEYFEQITNRETISGEFLDNTKNFILPGVYSARLDIKRANVFCEWQLSRLAEPFQALSSFFFNTPSRQKECDFACKTLIKNHAHDSIYACSIDEVSDKVLSRFEDVNTISSEIIDMTKYSLLEKDLYILNLSNFEFSGEIRFKTEKKLPKDLNIKKISSQKGFPKQLIYNTKYVPVTEDFTTINEYSADVKNLKPFSITKLTQNNICPKSCLISTKNSIENEFIRFEIKNDKVFVTDKKRNIEYENFFGIEDCADIGDSYNFGALKGDIKIDAKLFNFKFKRSDNITKEIELIYLIDIPAKSTNIARSKKVKKHRISLIVSLSNQSTILKFKAKWVNKSTDHLLKINFNLKENITKTLNEDLFGTVEREFNPDFDLNTLLPATRGTEIKPNTSPLKRFCAVQNFVLISKGNAEYEVSKNTLSLTLLRATGIISNPVNPTRGTPAGPPLLTPKLQQICENTAEFGVAFTSDKHEMFKLSEQFFTPCIEVFSNVEAKQFFKINNKNILVYAVKLHENDLVLRLFNLSDKKQAATLDFFSKVRIFETNPQENKKQETKPEIIFKGNEIKTLIISKEEK